ncbi:unnamed protein product [Trichobilharzia szidati]|nr:unnamed protein product [Trichobilharzia szidati]
MLMKKKLDYDCSALNNSCTEDISQFAKSTAVKNKINFTNTKWEELLGNFVSTSSFSHINLQLTLPFISVGNRISL